MKNYEWMLKIIDQVTGPLAKIERATGGADASLQKIAKSSQGLFFTLSNVNLVAGAFMQFQGAVTAATAPMMQFETAAAEVRAITGATAGQMDLMERAAKSVAVQMGGSAASHLSTYKGLLSELGPQLAEQPAALTSMGRSVAILSKSMGGDTQGAMAALTTGLQQFRVNLTNPTSAAQAMTFQMNVMAKAANVGAAEVPQIAAALKQAGVAASGARVSFVETNAAIQVLAQGGIKGAEAGTALRNVLAKMGEGRFMPKDVREGLTAAGVDVQKLSDKSLPLADRLRELAKVQGDGALVSKIFGLENQNAASILLRGIPQMQAYQTELVKGNAATDAANILMDTTAGRLDRMQALWTTAAIGVGEYLKPMLPTLQATAGMAQIGGQMAPALTLIGGGLKDAAVKTWDFAKANKGAALDALRFGGQLGATAVQSVGTFILSMGRGMLSIGAFAVRIRLQATLALAVLQARLRAFSMQTFLTSMVSGAASAVRAGAAWMWAGTVGLASLVAGFVRATVAQWALNIAMNANPIGAIVLGILALGTAVYLVIKHWDTIKQWLGNIGKWMLDHNPFRMLIDAAFKLFPGVRKFFSDLWSHIKGFLHSMLGSLKSVWDTIAPYLGFGSFKMPDLGNGLFAGSEDSGNGMGPGGFDPKSLGLGVESGLSSISGGGSKQTTFNITLGKFQDKIEIHTTTLQEGVNDAVTILDEALLRVLNGVQQLAPSN